MSLKYHKYLKLSDRSAFTFPTPDTQGFMINENNELRTGGTSKKSIDEPIGIKLPKFALDRKSKHITAHIINEKIVVLVELTQKPKDNYSIGNKDLLIYNNELQEWSKLNIPGTRTGTKDYGNYWFGGYVLEDNEERKFTNIIKKNSEAYWRFTEQGLYAPGILFLYNVKNKQYYEINTNDADSEILLIDNSNVYYRIYDEIYKSEIIGDIITDGELLVKSDIVQDIHWAFISK